MKRRAPVPASASGRSDGHAGLECETAVQNLAAKAATSAGHAGQSMSCPKSSALDATSRALAARIAWTQPSTASKAARSTSSACLLATQAVMFIWQFCEATA
ncbi:MAG: hypothetical protein KDJ40_14755, partial [Hyphomicrobiales bacterium]|nr:hypothetical protein [Hyphomicrobiales bacterium]